MNLITKSSEVLDNSKCISYTFPQESPALNDDPRTIQVSHEEEQLMLRIRQLRLSKLIRFVTLDLVEWGIVKKWSDAVERFAPSKNSPS